MPRVFDEGGLRAYDKPFAYRRHYNSADAYLARLVRRMYGSFYIGFS